MEPEASGLVIEWRLLLLSAGNFLLVLGILTWLVWKPLIQMIDDRRRTIAEGLAAAEAQQRAAAEADQERQRILQDAHIQAAELVKKTRADLTAERDDMRQEMQTERSRLLEHTQKEVADERTKMEAELKDSMVTLIGSALTRIIGSQTDSVDRWQPLAKQALKDLGAQEPNQ